MNKLTTFAKLCIVFAILGIIASIKIFWYDKREVDAKDSMDIGKIVLPDNPEASFKSSAMQLPLPSNKEVNNGGTRINWEIMAWNSQFPLMYANGGANTTKGSLFDQKKLNINIIRQDDTNKSMADLISFAQQYKDNPNTPGLIVSYMGDAMSVGFDYLSKQLEPLGPEYQPIGFYTMGLSLGEDKLLAPLEWRKNPKAAIGKTICVFLRDGDMNIALKWLGDNNIKINPDEKTYDSLAVNFVAANDFLDAANKYIVGYTEERRIVRNGKITNDKITVGVDAVATWTPGDVNIAKQKGGLVSIASTKDYSTQMPNLSITIKKFAYDHRTDIENIIWGLGVAGDQVRSFSNAKKFAAEVSAKVYNDNDKPAAYWLKYYDGVVEKDIQGLSVELGGSRAFNLKDAANMLGLGDDGIDRYKIVYTTFGDKLSKMYPDILPSYPPYNKVIDKSFLQTVLSNNETGGDAAETVYSDEIVSEVSKADYQIQFKSGSAIISSVSKDVLNDIFESAMIAENLNIQINGYTDNVGNDESNLILSKNRANAVKNYLLSKGLSEERIIVKGFGEEFPIADNSTSQGQYLNRRVEIILGK